MLYIRFVGIKNLYIFVVYCSIFLNKMKNVFVFVVFTSIGEDFISRLLRFLCFFVFYKRIGTNSAFLLPWRLLFVFLNFIMFLVFR